MQRQPIAIFYSARSISSKKMARKAQELMPNASIFQASSPRSVEEILNALDKTSRQLLTRTHPMFLEIADAGSLDLLDILETPLAIKNGEGVFCKEPTDVYKLADLSKSATFF